MKRDGGDIQGGCSVCVGLINFFDVISGRE